MIIVRSERYTHGPVVQALHAVTGVTIQDVGFNGTVSVRWPVGEANDPIKDPHLTLRAYTSPTQGGTPLEDSKYRKKLTRPEELELREKGADSIIGSVFTCDTCRQQRNCGMLKTEGITIDLKGGPMADYVVSTIPTKPDFDSKQADCVSIRKLRRHRRGPNDKKIIYKQK
jgi:hypothetical protein